MAFTLDVGAVGRLGSFFNETIGQHLRRPEQRAAFATYAIGLFGDGERKSAEPIAARASADPTRCRAMHEHLLRFVSLSPWSDQFVRLEAARYVIAAMSERESVNTWIIDDTGFPKQGRHSVGVQRQYTGSTGKISNCQIGVSLVVATRAAQVPIDFELYLPKSWIENSGRRARTRIPDTATFKTKPELALDLIVRALDERIPGEIVLADSAYGGNSDFRNTVRTFGLDYGVAVQASTKVWVLDSQNRRRGDACSVQELGIKLGSKAFRKVTWREGSAGELASRFCFCRVKVAHDDGSEAADREPVWLLIEWPESEEKPTKFVLTTLPRRMSKKQIVRIIKERWRTEQAYQELKGELGLDHFEGRSFPGWHHHVSVALCCYAFIVAERVRHFPPSARRNRPHRALECAA